MLISESIKQAEKNGKAIGKTMCGFRDYQEFYYKRRKLITISQKKYTEDEHSAYLRLAWLKAAFSEAGLLLDTVEKSEEAKQENLFEG